MDFLKKISLPLNWCFDSASAVLRNSSAPSVRAREHAPKSPHPKLSRSTFPPPCGPSITQETAQLLPKLVQKGKTASNVGTLEPPPRQGRLVPPLLQRAGAAETPSRAARAALPGAGFCSQRDCPAPLPPQELPARPRASGCGARGSARPTQPPVWDRAQPRRQPGTSGEQGLPSPLGATFGYNLFKGLYVSLKL